MAEEKPITEKDRKAVEPKSGGVKLTNMPENSAEDVDEEAKPKRSRGK